MNQKEKEREKQKLARLSDHLMRVRKNYRLHPKVARELEALCTILNRSSLDRVRSKITDDQVEMIKQFRVITETEVVEQAISYFLSLIIKMVKDNQLGAGVDFSDVLPKITEVRRAEDQEEESFNEIL